MATSRFELTGRFLAGIAAASLLAGISMDAAAAGGRGTIDLRLSSSGGANEFRWENPADGLLYQQQFNIEAGTKCIVDDDGWSNYKDHALSASHTPSLVDLKAIRDGGPVPTKGGGEPNSGVGLLGGSLGVYDSTKGTSCSRMSDYLHEGLVVTSMVGTFDELRLDMEVKGSAVFKVIIDPDPDHPKVESGRKVYQLCSGINLNDCKDQLGNVEPGSFICTAGSDSGPDSGINDNCLWEIKDIGRSFSLFPVGSNSTGVAREGSLEGGDDYVNAGVSPVRNTQILLTSRIDVGTLSCDGSSNPDNMTALVFDPVDPAAQCMVTRIGTPGGACDYLLNYKLETFSFDSLCSLDKTAWVKGNEILPAASNHKQVAGANQVTFTVEDRTVWDIKQTYMTFTKEDGSQTDPYYLSRCGGTVVQVDKDGNIVTTGPRETTIQEVLERRLEGYLDDGGFFVAGPPDDGWSDPSDPSSDLRYVQLTDTVASGDAVPGNQLIDWACILDNTETYVGDDEMYVTQHILFWGDAYFGRN
jgi:hypothetical protein